MYLSPYSVMKKMDPTLPAGVAVMFNPLAAGLSWAGSIPGTGPTRPRGDPRRRPARPLLRQFAARPRARKQVVITGLGRDAEKLALARALGADAAVDVEKNDVVTSVRDATGGGAEVVVDTTPYAPQSLNHAVAIAVRKGRIVRRRLKGCAAAQDFAVDEGDLQGADDSCVLSMPVDETIPRRRHHRIRPLPVSVKDAHALRCARAGEDAIPMLAAHVRALTSRSRSVQLATAAAASNGRCVRSRRATAFGRGATCWDRGAHAAGGVCQWSAGRRGADGGDRPGRPVPRRRDERSTPDDLHCAKVTYSRGGRVDGRRRGRSSKRRR